MEKIILIKVPNEIYSELRKIFVSLFENSGFKDVKINKTVDFEKLYLMKKLNKNFFLSSDFKNSLCFFISSSDILTIVLL